MTDESLKNQISNTEKEVKKAEQSLQEQTKAASEVANKIADKQKELDNYNQQF